MSYPWLHTQQGHRRETFRPRLVLVSFNNLVNKQRLMPGEGDVLFCSSLLFNLHPFSLRRKGFKKKTRFVHVSRVCIQLLE